MRENRANNRNRVRLGGDTLNADEESLAEPMYERMRRRTDKQQAIDAVAERLNSGLRVSRVARRHQADNALPRAQPAMWM